MAEHENHEPVAIIGLGCVLPDAAAPTAFWQNQLAGHSALRPLRGPLWEGHFDPDPRAPDRTTSLIGARVEGFQFDWRRFRIPPAEAADINPLQLMILDAGAQALGAVRVLPRETTGIVLGALGLGWQRDSGLRIRLPVLCAAVEDSPAFQALAAPARAAVLAAARAALDRELKPVSEDNVINASASVAAGRIAMYFDLRGLHYSVDAGFASAMSAAEAGVRLLRDGTLDTVLVGGSSELLTPLELIAMAKLGVLAPRELRSFDQAAQGTLLGEGVAVFALKRLSDAERDGETILAVLRGVGGATVVEDDLTTVRPAGLVQAQRRAYAEAGIAPDTVGLLECDAPGSPAADAAEVRALVEVLGRDAQPGVMLSSAKPFVGHARAAAGAVGLLRAVLCLHHRVVPAQIGFQSPHPALELEATPFQIPTTSRPLSARGGAAQPRAGVSAIGLGGIYYHALLEGYSGDGRPVRKTVPLAAPTIGATSPAVSAASGVPIAITGMGGSFPGARGVPALWRRLQEGYDATREVPPERWLIDQYYDPDTNRLDTAYTRIGCFLDELPGDAARFGVPAAAHAALDPSQLLVLEAADEALADAGYAPGRWDPARVSVILAFLPYQGKKFLADLRAHFVPFGAALSDALLGQGVPQGATRLILQQAEERAKAGLPPITAHTLTGYLGSVNAARVAARHGFRGPHCVVDSACASTHAAMHAAVRALQQGACDVVLCGGVWCDVSPEFYVAACRFNALSATGSHPFSSRADGFIPGEGGGVFVLRRLADAERLGEPIHAVLRAVAGSSDGRGRSVLAPSPEGESMAMRRALREAGLLPEQVDYVECHGTGTPLGDAVEADACTRAFGPGRARPLMLGSAKSNIGHLNAAAGVPALIKAVMAVKTGELPPSLKCDPPSQKIDFARAPLQVVRTTTQWTAPEGQPRRAGVSGFGVGGTNLHMIVEQHVPAAPASVSSGGGGGGADSASADLVTVFAARGDNLSACAAELWAQLGRLRRGASLASVLGEAQQRAAAGPGERVAVVASDAATLEARLSLLEAALQRGQPPSFLQTQGIFTGRPEPSVPVAVLFPGQGPQYPQMMAGLVAQFPALRADLDAVDLAYRRLAGRPLSPCFLQADPGGGGAGPAHEDSHCAVFAVNCLIFGLLRRFGLRCDAVLGQSAGELAALVAAEVLTIEQGLLAMRERTLAVLELRVADPGQMVALSCGAAQARKLLAGLPGRIALAADNAPSSSIVSGEQPALEEFLRRCAGAGVDATLLPVSHGYHSEIIAGATPRYLAALRGLRYRRPVCAVASTITGGLVSGPSGGGLAAADYPQHLASQYVRPVLLPDAVEALYRAGVRLFLESGPKWSLTGFVGQILKDRSHVAQATMHPKIGEVEQLHRALACLFVHGAAGLRPQGAPQSLPEVATWAVHPSGVAAQPEKHVERPLMAERQPSSTDDSAQRSAAQLLDLVKNIHGLIGDFLAQCDAVTPSRAAEPVAARAPEPVAARAPEPVAPRSPTPRPYQSLRPEAHALPEQAPTPRPEPAAPVAPVSAPRATTAHREAAIANPPWSSRPIASPAAPTAPAAERQPTGPASFERVRTLLLERLVAKTGYPVDMLDLDLDMEADLGIDTVRQVAIIGEARASLGLSQDPGFKLRDYPTIRKAVQYLLGRLQAEGGAVAPPAPTSDRVAAVVTPPEPTLPFPPLAQAAPSPQTEGLPLLHTLLLGARARHPAATAILGLEQLRVGVPAPLHGALSVEPVTPPARPDAPRFQLVLPDGAVAMEGGVVFASGMSAAAPTAPPLPAEIAAALDRRGKPRNGVALFSAVQRTGGAAGSVASESLVWAWSSHFDEVTGAVRLGGPLSEPADASALSTLCEAVFWLADFGWYGLSGALCRLGGLNAARFYRVPQSQEELLVHVRLLSSPAGAWSADALVADSAHAVVATFEGLSGVALGQPAGSVNDPGRNDGAALAWQHFHRRMHHVLLAGEDHTW